MNQPAFILEVIACTVADAIEAEIGGAGFCCKKRAVCGQD